jgi:hypothetical protein
MASVNALAPLRWKRAKIHQRIAAMIDQAA